MVGRDFLHKDMPSYGAAMIRNLLICDEGASGQPVYYKTYGNMDWIVQHREKYSLGISMFSSGIGIFTLGNDENREGHHTYGNALSLHE